MRRILKVNPNTQRYWDGRYENFSKEGDDIQKNEIIANHIIDDSRVIELGCGPGWLLSRIKTKRPNCEVTGVDFSQRAITKLKEDERIKAIKADFTKKSVGEDNSYNYVIASEVLEHLEKPGRLVKEMARLLVDGGMAILTAPYEDHIPSAEHLWEFTTDDIKEMFSGLFSKFWVYPWASGYRVYVLQTGELVYPPGHLDVIWVIAIK